MSLGNAFFKPSGSVIIQQGDASEVPLRSAQVFRQTNQLIPVGAWTKIEFDGVDHDPNSMYDADNDQFVAPAADTYTIMAKIGYTQGALPDPVDDFTARLYVNDVAVPRTETYWLNDWGNPRRHLVLQHVAELAEGDVIDLRVLFSTNQGNVEAITTAMSISA